jgi:hypothetical protein
VGYWEFLGKVDTHGREPAFERTDRVANLEGSGEWPKRHQGPMKNE